MDALNFIKNNHKEYENDKDIDYSLYDNDNHNYLYYYKKYIDNNKLLKYCEIKDNKATISINLNNFKFEYTKSSTKDNYIDLFVENDIKCNNILLNGFSCHSNKEFNTYIVDGNPIAWSLKFNKCYYNEHKNISLYLLIPNILLKCKKINIIVEQENLNKLLNNYNIDIFLMYSQNALKHNIYFNYDNKNIHIISYSDEYYPLCHIINNTAEAVFLNDKEEKIINKNNYNMLIDVIKYQNEKINKLKQTIKELKGNNNEHKIKQKVSVKRKVADNETEDSLENNNEYKIKQKVPVNRKVPDNETEDSLDNNTDSSDDSSDYFDDDEILDQIEE